MVLKWLLKRKRKEETGGDERNMEQVLTARTEIIFVREEEEASLLRYRFFLFFSLSLDKLSPCPLFQSC